MSQQKDSEATMTQTERERKAEEWADAYSLPNRFYAEDGFKAGWDARDDEFMRMENAWRNKTGALYEELHSLRSRLALAEKVVEVLGFLRDGRMNYDALEFVADWLDARLKERK